MLDTVREPNEHERARTEKFMKLMNDFSDVCNTFNSDPKDFIEGFCRQHRTLQQNMFRMIGQLIAHMSTDDYRTDGRNEASKKMAEKFMKGYAEMFEQSEFDVYLRCGYDVETSNTKAKESRKMFDKNPANYMGLPTV